MAKFKRQRLLKSNNMIKNTPENKRKVNLFCLFIVLPIMLTVLWMAPKCERPAQEGETSCPVKEN
jgi:hypothetical protein